MSKRGSRSNAAQSHLSIESTATLRARLAALRATERSLIDGLPAVAEPNSLEHTALSRLDEPTKTALRELDEAAVYREWVQQTRARIVELTARVGRRSPSRIIGYLKISLKNLWLVAWALFFGWMANNVLLLSYRPWANTGWPYIAVYLLLSSRFVLPDAIREHEETLVTVEKQKDELAALKDAERNRTRIASAIKVAGPYLKALAKAQAARAQLAETQRVIDDHVSVLKKRTDRSRTSVPSAVRRAVWIRDGSACVMCKQGHVEGARLHLDHIIPYSLGGSDIEENLQVLCQTCNLKKGAKI